MKEQWDKPGILMFGLVAYNSMNLLDLQSVKELELIYIKS